MELSQLKQEVQNAFNVDFPIDIKNLASDVINESISELGIMGRYSAFIDRKVKSNVLRSILKFDIFVLIGYILSLPTLGIWLQTSGVADRLAATVNYNFSAITGFLGITVTPGAITTTVFLMAGIIVKLLVTRYDRNGDARLDINDTLITQKYLSPVTK